MFRFASPPIFAVYVFLWKFPLTRAIEVSIENQCTLRDDACSLAAHSPVRATSLLQSDARRSEVTPVRSQRRKDDEVMHRDREVQESKEKPESIRSLASRVRVLESQVATTENADSSAQDDSKRSTSSKAQGEVIQPVYSKKCSTTDEKQCVFGVDSRDEGSHCIPELDYGQYGWCYTRKDMTTWGPCASSCPLSGRFGVLQRKLTDLSGKMKELQNEVDDMPDCGGSKGAKKAPKSGAKTPPDNNPSDDAPKKVAKPGAKPLADDADDDDVKDSKAGSKFAMRRTAPSSLPRTHRVAPESIPRKHRVAMSGIKSSSRSVAKRSPLKERQRKEEPLMLKWNKKMALQAKSHAKEA